MESARRPADDPPPADPLATAVRSPDALRAPRRRVRWGQNIVAGTLTIPRLSEDEKRAVHCTPQDFSRWRMERDIQHLAAASRPPLEESMLDACAPPFIGTVKQQRGESRQRWEQQQLDPRPHGPPAEPLPSPGPLPPGPESYYAVLARGPDEANSGRANTPPLEPDAVADAGPAECTADAVAARATGARRPKEGSTGGSVASARDADEGAALLAAIADARTTAAEGSSHSAPSPRLPPKARAAAQKQAHEQRRRARTVQGIALCERLGLPYRTVDAKPRPRRSLKKPPRPPPAATGTEPAPAASAAPPPPPPDALQAMAEDNARLLSRIGWRKLATRRRGRSALSDDVGDLPHEAAGYLDYLRRLGAPVHSSAPPKSPEDLQAAVDRGPHQSAEAHREFLWEESLEMCKRRHTMVLPFSAVKHLRGVQVSPPGVVPQANRRPRTIADLTFWGVNASTVDLTHKEAMQFGRALRRILFQIYRAGPRWGPVYLAKVDISDGFYNISVNADGSKNFGIVLPSAPGQEPLILFFLGLPMGWVSSPPVFCAATESVADVANAKISGNWCPLPHLRDEVADTPTPLTRPWSVRGKPPRIKHCGKGIRVLGTLPCSVGMR